MTSWFQVTRQHLCIGFLLLMCFLSYLMYNLDINLTSFSLCRVSPPPGPEDRVSPPPGPEDRVSPPPGPEDIVNMSLQLLNPNTSDQQMGPQSVHTEEDILILMWFWPFGDKVNIRCSELDMEGCRLTDDRSVYHEAHAVLFHHRDIHGGLDNMPPGPRPWFQKWIWFNWESPANSNNIPALDDLFNLTSSYRLDSHIPVPYGYLTPLTQEDEKFTLPEKDKLVCWVVSNWNPQYERVQVYEEMIKHIKIELYGRAFDRAVTHQEYVEVMRRCKFYLSWENSIDRDYVSDKLYDPLRMGAVPVVLGPSRANYEDHVPGDSFIHVDDFAGGPKELAERLVHLGNNHTEYMRYFQWRERYKVHRHFFVSDQVCRACQHLKIHKGYQSFHGLSKWFWG